MGIIGIVALLIFGPDKLPEVMGQAGKMVRDFRNMTAGLTGEFEKTMAEAREIGNSVTKELGGMTKEVNAVTNSVKKDLNTSKTTTPAPKKGMTSASAKKAGASTSSTAATKASTAGSTPKPTTTTKAPASTTSASSSATTTAKPATAIVPPTPKASREDPIADISLFEPAPMERKPRARRATPTTFGGVDVFASTTMPDGDAAAIADALAHGDEVTLPASSDDALLRARQRRQTAGYSQR